jgi:hypothetical protein
LQRGTCEQKRYNDAVHHRASQRCEDTAIERGRGLPGLSPGHERGSRQREFQSAGGAGRALDP